MSRRRPPRRTPTGPPRNESVVLRDGQEWVVRRLTGAASTKPYRCPGCQQTIPKVTPHVVVWPKIPSLFSDSGLDERRHWHTSCWQRLG